MLAIQPLTNKEFNSFSVNWTAQTKYLTFFKNISNKYGFIRGESGPDLIFLFPLIPVPPHIRTHTRNNQNAPPISRQFILNIFFDQFYNANIGSDTANIIHVRKESSLYLVSHRRGQPSHIKSSHVQPTDRLQKQSHNAIKRLSIIPKGMSHAFPPLEKKRRHGELDPAMMPQPALNYPVSFGQQPYLRNAGPTHIKCSPSWTSCSSWFNPHIYHKGHKVHEENSVLARLKRIPTPCALAQLQNDINLLSTSPRHLFQRISSHYLHPLSKKWIHRSLDSFVTRGIYGTKDQAGTTELANFHPGSPGQHNFFQNTIQTVSILPLQKKRRLGAQEPDRTSKQALNYPVSFGQQPYLRNAGPTHIEFPPSWTSWFNPHIYHKGHEVHEGNSVLAHLKRISKPCALAQLQNDINLLSTSPRHLFQRISSHYLCFLQKGRNKGRPNAAMIPDLAAHVPDAGGQQKYLPAAQKKRMVSYPQMRLPEKPDNLLPYHSKTAEKQAGQEKTEQKIRIFHDAKALLENIVYKQNTNIDQLLKQSMKTEQIQNKNHGNMMQPKYPGQEYPPAQSHAAMTGLSHRETQKLAGQVYQLIAKQVAFEKRRRGLS